MQQFFSAPAIFTGETWLNGYAILMKGGRMEALVPQHELPADARPPAFPGCIIAPAFIDLQVYGTQNRLFASAPTAETLALMAENFRRQGTLNFLPTVASNTAAVMKKCMDAVRQYWRNGGEGVLGLHLEGPWINVLKKGAHVTDCIHAPSAEEVTDLLNYGEGLVKMVTLAPEICTREIIGLLKSRQIVVSAGHSDAGMAEAEEGFANGITAVTHLFNAMSGLHHRNPGLAAAAMANAQVQASIIADGHHVSFAMITLAKKMMGPRLFAITDAVAAAEEGLYQHRLAGDHYECNGVLSGSALTMHQALLNLVERSGIELDEALRMCSLYPARVMGLDGHYGRIAAGCEGGLVVIRQDLSKIERVVSEAG